MIEARLSDIRASMPAWVEELPLTGADALRSVAERLPHALLVTDLSCTRLLFTNPAFLRVWGAHEALSLPQLIDLMASQAAVPPQVIQIWSQLVPRWLLVRPTTNGCPWQMAAPLPGSAGCCATETGSRGG